MKMTKDELAEILAQHKLWLDMRNTGDVKGKRANLRGANLTGADLARASLHGADLTEADLRDASLTRASLTRADLTRANLTRGVEFVQVAGIGSVRRSTVYRIDTDEVWCCCFHGTLNEFCSRVAGSYSDGKYRKQYDAAIVFFKSCREVWRAGQAEVKDAEAKT